MIAYEGKDPYIFVSYSHRDMDTVMPIIAELKNAEMIVVEGTLYPLLTRLKNAGYLTYRWEESIQGPPRKYYTLTEEGRTHLASLDEAWDTLVEQISNIRNKH